MSKQEPLFERVALIGIGLIGSSLAHVIRREGLAREIVVSTRRADTLARAEELGLSDRYEIDAAEAVKDADLVILSVPVGACGAVAKHIGPYLKPGAILSDSGSTKGSVIRDVGMAVWASRRFGVTLPPFGLGRLSRPRIQETGGLVQDGP